MERLTDRAAISQSFATGAGEGVIDFYVDSQLALSEQFSNSWDLYGIPTREPDLANPGARAKRTQLASSARAKVARLEKSSNLFDREWAGELQEIFGPDSCFAQLVSGR